VKENLMRLGIAGTLLICMSRHAFAVPASVPDPVTTMTLLGVGVAGVGGYWLIRKRKDK
jgi:LPXTG-motif cell wall-anchored protein